MKTDELIKAVIKWGEDRNLNDPKAQMNKVIEEVGEMAHEITRNRYDSDELSDAVGDTLTTIILLAHQCGKDPVECLRMAYNEIKDRKGKTENGTFVKSV